MIKYPIGFLQITFQINELVNDQLGHLPVARYEVCAQNDMIKIKCRALRKLYPAETGDGIGFMVVGYEAVY